MHQLVSKSKFLLAWMICTDHHNTRDLISNTTYIHEALEQWVENNFEGGFLFSSFCAFAAKHFLHFLEFSNFFLNWWCFKILIKMQGNKNAPFWEKQQPNVSLTQKNIHDTCAFRSLCSSRLSVVSTFVFQFYLDTHICMAKQATKKSIFPIHTSFSWQTSFYIDQDLSSCKENKTTWVMKIWWCIIWILTDFNNIIHPR